MTSAVFCSECGTPIVSGGRFCASCGTPVAAPAPSTSGAVRTVVREYASAAQRDADMARMAEFEWSVQNVQTIPGKYKAGKGVALAVVFLPLALAAGNKADRYIVTYATTKPVGQALLPPQVWA